MNKEILKIAKDVREQEKLNKSKDTSYNHIFIVQEGFLRHSKDYGEYDCDGYIWINKDGETLDDKKISNLCEALTVLKSEASFDNETYIKLYFKKAYNYVTACFTEKGCQKYIDERANYHRGKLRISSRTSEGNPEMDAIRAFLIGLEE